MPTKRGALTRQEAAFAETYAATGDAQYAAARAGYSQPRSHGYRQLAKPAVLAEIARVQRERLYNEALPLAVNTLQAIMSDEKAPAGARVQAAKVVLDRTLGSVDEGQRKELHEMTHEEIQEALARLRAEVEERARPRLELQPQPGSPDVFG